MSKKLFTASSRALERGKRAVSAVLQVLPSIGLRHMGDALGHAQGWAPCIPLRWLFHPLALGVCDLQRARQTVFLSALNLPMWRGQLTFSVFYLNRCFVLKREAAFRKLVWWALCDACA